MGDPIFLLAALQHILNDRLQVFIAAIGAEATSGHNAVEAIDGVLNQGVQALLEPDFPFDYVPNLRRLGSAGAVTGKIGRLVFRLGVEIYSFCRHHISCG